MSTLTCHGTAMALTQQWLTQQWLTQQWLTQQWPTRQWLTQQWPTQQQLTQKWPTHQEIELIEIAVHQTQLSQACHHVHALPVNLSRVPQLSHLPHTNTTCDPISTCRSRGC